MKNLQTKSIVAAFLLLIFLFMPNEVLSMMGDSESGGIPQVQMANPDPDRSGGGGGGCGDDCNCVCLNDEASCLFWSTLLGLGPSTGYIWCAFELLKCYDDCDSPQSSSTSGGGGGGSFSPGTQLRRK